MTERNRSIRIVSFLGIGRKDADPPYEPCVYELDGVRSRQSPLVTVGIVEGLREQLEPDDGFSIVLLATDEARKLWFDTPSSHERSRYERYLEDAGLADLPVGFIELPIGDNSSDLWRIFDRVEKAVRPAPVFVTRATGHRKGEQMSLPQATDVVVDITHGFRTQPLFAMSAVAFAQSETRRETSEGDGATAPNIRVLYGAYEAAKLVDGQKVEPLWDLTLFLEVLRWNAAIDALMRFGRADDVEAMTRAFTRARPPQERRETAPLDRLAQAARQFADDLATIRIPQLLRDDSRMLVEACRAARDLVSEHIPPLGPQLDRLCEWAEAVRAESVVSVEGVQAALALARLYDRLQRPAELAATLRETMVTAYTLMQVEAKDLEQPGRENFRRQRDEMEKRLNWGASWAQQWSGIAQRRNDVLHGGFNNQPASAQRLRRALRETIAEVESLVEPLVKGVPGVRPKRFVNISNHPVATWSERQLEAARRLVDGGEVVDLDGPPLLVEPNLRTDQVVRRARELVTRTLELEPAVVHVMGEHSLVYALVTMLQVEGIRVVTSTTERVAEEIVEGDRTIRTAEFSFVAFRDYPSPRLSLPAE